MNDLIMQIGMIAAVIGGVSAVAGLLYTIYKIAHRIDAAIGVDDKGRTVSDRIDRVEYQLWPNNGESLKDQVNNIDRHSRETAAEVKFIKDILVQMVAMPNIPVAEEKMAKPRKKKSSAA